MKKFVWILLCAAMLAGCSTETVDATTAATTAATTEATTAPTTQPVETTVPEPDTASGTALTDKTLVLLTTAERGAIVDVVGNYDDTYYTVKTAQGYGLVEKALLRLEGGQAYTQWIGYACSNAAFYENYLLSGEPAQRLGMNTQLQVLEDVGRCLVVQVGDAVGYMRDDEVSRYYIQPAPGGGGSADGGDISLRRDARIVLLSNFVPQEGEVTGRGIVLVDGAQILLGWYDRGEAVPVITEAGYAEEKAGWVAVYYDGLCGYVQQQLIRQEGAQAYAQWDGFATFQAPLYDNYYLSGDPVIRLSANANIRILEDLGNCYLVSCGDLTGYLARENASESYINYGSGGSGDSGGDWTPPAM